MLKHALIVMTLAGVAHADASEQTRIKALEAQVAKLEARIAALEAASPPRPATVSSAPSDTAVFTVEVAESVKAGLAQGAATAPVTLVWAFDMADRYSAKMEPIVEELVTRHKGKLRVVYKHMIVHPQTAVLAHQAACAAGKQGKFAAFYRAWWEKFDVSKPQRPDGFYERDSIVAVAKSAGLDTKQLETDMAGETCRHEIAIDAEQMRTLNVQATPTFFLNGRKSAGAEDAAAFGLRVKAAIDDAGKKR